MRKLYKNITKGDWSLLSADGHAVTEKQEVRTATHGDKYFVTGGAPPHKPESTGRVYVVHSLKDKNCMDREFFPSVFNMRWVYKCHYCGCKERPVVESDGAWPSCPQCKGV